MSNFDPLHDINIGPGGTFKRSGVAHSTPAQIDALFSAIESGENKKVVIHFHGGLISEETGIQIARKMTPLYTGAGAYPINIIWETGLWETVSRNMSDLRNTALFKKLFEYALSQVKKRFGLDLDGRGSGGEELTPAELAAIWESGSAEFGSIVSGRGAGQATSETAIDAMADQIQAELNRAFQQDTELKTALESEAPFTEMLDEELRTTVQPGARGISWAEVAFKLSKVVIAVLKRYLKGQDHGVVPTVVEEILRHFYLSGIGQWIWTGMKDIAVDTYQPNSGALTSESYVGSYLLDKISELKQNHADVSIDLVGHSAGSIMICNLLKAASERYQNIKPRNIIFLAPACTSELFHEEVASKPARFETFRMYTMSDEFESSDQLLAPLYPRSLLYFISGVLEEETDTPIAGMERYLSDGAPYDSDFLKENRRFLLVEDDQRMILSVTGPQAPIGRRSHSTKHGDFDDDARTRESIAHIISQG